MVVVVDCRIEACASTVARGRAPTGLTGDETGVRLQLFVRKVQELCSVGPL